MNCFLFDVIVFAMLPAYDIWRAGRFPFNKNHRFKFSEFSLVEWNASDRFPGFEVTCSATQGMLGDILFVVCLGREETDE